MDLIKIAGIGVLAVFISVLLKQYNKEYALLVSAAFGLIIMGFVVSQSGTVIRTMTELYRRTNLNFQFFDIVLKAIGISYLCYFAQNMAKDAGENTIAAQIELAGKMMLLVLSLPVLLSVVELLVKLINE